VRYSAKKRVTIEAAVLLVASLLLSLALCAQIHKAHPETIPSKGLQNEVHPHTTSPQPARPTTPPADNSKFLVSAVAAAGVIALLFAIVKISATRSKKKARRSRAQSASFSDSGPQSTAPVERNPTAPTFRPPPKPIQQTLQEKQPTPSNDHPDIAENEVIRVRPVPPPGKK
jgi:hypothetical protein